MVTKLSHDNINMSYKIVERKLKKLGYKNSLSVKTPIFTAIQKKKGLNRLKII